MRAQTLVRTTAAALALVTLAHLAAQLVGHDGASDATQVLLMPAVAAWLAARTAPGPRQRLVRVFLLGLTFSWVGDTAPRLLDADAGFLAMVGAFFVAQVIYAVALWPLRRGSAAARAPWSLVGYAAALAGVVAVCAQEAGPLLPAVVVYAAALATTSVLAWGLGTAAGVGGLVFLASDAMIALREFAPWFEPPQGGLLVMGTYIAAQALLADAVARRAAAGARTALPLAGARR